MKRREFISLLGGAAAAWPLAARAQQAGKLPTIGILGSGSAAWSHLVAALVQRLRELGYIENRSVAIEYRWTEGRSERHAASAAELVRLTVDVIVALGTPAIVAVKNATAVIPIVFPLASDPSATAWSRHLRNRAATSQACRTCSPTLPASGSKSCARSSPVSPDWRCWPAIIPPPC
jgi:putative ABC transport system substrate-binding protein